MTRPQDNDPRRYHAQDGAAEQAELVADILKAMRDKPRLVVQRAARTTTRWNACLRRYVEVR